VGGSEQYLPPRKVRLARNLRYIADTLAEAIEAQRKMETDIARLQSDIAAYQQRTLYAAAEPVRGDDHKNLAARRAAAGEKRGRAAVVSWDMGHNPVGRALVLYQLLERDWEVEMIGPSWSRYGTGLWGPAVPLGLKTRLFPCHDLGDFLPQAVLQATRSRFDLVYVCKPRLPSLLLGLMIKEHSGCPLILDIDDHELSFFKDFTPSTFEALETGGMDALREPYEELATRFCETLIPDADAITVSNVALRRRFGGHIVRHARDETTFAPNTYDRAVVRQELGISAEEFALIFVGTPRQHKGIDDIARALQEMDDPTLCLHIIGDITDRRVMNRFRKYDKANITFHPNCSFAELPRILSAADAVPLLQDTAHPISSYQIPGKLSDATALGIPVLMTNVPPIEDLARMGGLTIVSPDGLAESLRTLRAERDPTNCRRIREFFLSELSLSVNRTRLDLAIEAACEAPKPLPPSYDRLKGLVLRCFGEIVRARQLDNLPVKPSARARRANKRVFDVAFFWKQNDTGLYGRRSDMIVKYLLKSGRVGRIMQFDAPFPADMLQRHRTEGAQPSLAEDALVLRNTLARWARHLDTERLKQRVFVFAGKEVTSNRGKRPGGQACARHRLTRSGRRGTSVSAALSLAPR
jgi:glycosyltransferase involved in cell wall biosynthesis